ncbi:MAG: hypothetical protein QXK80_01515 [Candidatus Pacearchaeota archaeon]
MKIKPFLIGTMVLALFLMYAPKLNNYLNEEPQPKRKLEDQIKYNDSLIKNYSYSNLYVLKEPKGKSWKKFIDDIKRKDCILINYCADECISCNYSKEYFIKTAMENKNIDFFIINYRFFDDNGKELVDSLEKYNLNEHSLPTFVFHKKGKKQKIDYTRKGLLKLKFINFFQLF